MGTAKRDSYGVPGLLGHGKNGVIPVKATEDGRLLVQVEGSIGSGGGSNTIIAPQYNYHLVKTSRLNLSTARNKEPIQVEFDCLAIGDLKGNLTLTINQFDLTINKCLSMDVTASSVQVTNGQQEGYCELWFFKKEKVVD